MLKNERKQKIYVLRLNGAYWAELENETVLQHWLADGSIEDGDLILRTDNIQETVRETKITLRDVE